MVIHGNWEHLYDADTWILCMKEHSILSATSLPCTSRRKLVELWSPLTWLIGRRPQFAMVESIRVLVSLLEPVSWASDRLENRWDESFWISASARSHNQMLVELVSNVHRHGICRFLPTRSVFTYAFQRLFTASSWHASAQEGPRAHETSSMSVAGAFV